MFRYADVSRAQETLQSMQERQHEIRKIEQSVNELHQLFLEMGTMVERQGATITRLKEHVHATEDFTEQAVTQTGQAAEKKRSLRKVSFGGND